MYKLILMLTAAAVPATAASPALAATDGQPVAANSAESTLVVPVASRTISAGEQISLAAHDDAALELTPIPLDHAPSACSELALPTTVHTGTTPRTEAARAPPLSLPVD